MSVIVARLEQANLWACNSKGAFLLVARLAQANLRNARLKGGADLSGTTGLSEEQLRDAHEAMTLTDPAEGRAWAVWLLDHEPAA